MRRAPWLLGGVLALSSTPLSARAFSEPLLYPEPTTNGGGGGRFFTGSPLDSFSCAVCHEGGTQPTVTLRGLPDSYEAGEEYELELEWSDPEEPHSLTLEIVDADGRAGGVIALPDEADVDEDGRCALSEDPAARDQLASFLTESGPRQIVGVSACGARSLRFSFTAPDEPKLALTASILRSDKSEDTTGDGVLTLRRVLYRKGESRPAPASCALTTERGSAGLAALLITLASLLLVRRRMVSRRP